MFLKGGEYPPFFYAYYVPSGMRMNASVKYGILLVLLTGTAYFLGSLFILAPSFYLYLAALNTAVFIVCGIDKSLAGTAHSRVPEMLFYIAALLGGSPGLLAAMGIFRHKTRKAPFQVIVVFICILQIAVLKIFFEDISDTFISGQTEVQQWA